LEGRRRKNPKRTVMMRRKNHLNIFIVMTSVEHRKLIKEAILQRKLRVFTSGWLKGRTHNLWILLFAQQWR